MQSFSVGVACAFLVLIVQTAPPVLALTNTAQLLLAWAPVLRHQESLRLPEMSSCALSLKIGKHKSCSRALRGGSASTLANMQNNPSREVGKKPWERLNLAVYSVSSCANHAGDVSPTMNIATYVSTASLPRPDQDLIYAVALFKTSLTYSNVKSTGKFLLQLLSSAQADVVETLGKKSGRDVDKIAAVRALGHSIETLNGMPYMTSSLGVSELTVLKWMDAEDHELALCRVDSTFNTISGHVLYTDPLRTAGILAKQ